MPAAKIETGPVGARVAANVRAIREERGWSQRQLADEIRQEGRAIDAAGVARIESTERRVSVDDLVALACALDVTVDRLLLPNAYADDDVVDLTAARQVSSRRAWDWARGLEALPRRADEGPAPWARTRRRHVDGETRLLTDDELRLFPRRPPGEWGPDVLPDRLWRQVAGEETRSHLPWEPVDIMQLPGLAAPDAEGEK